MARPSVQAPLDGATFALPSSAPGQGTPRNVTRGRRGSSYWFYVGMAVAALVVSVAAFAPSLVDQSARREPVSKWVAVHGAVLLAWLLAFLAQTLLVATRRVRVHRALGLAAAALVPAVLGTGYVVSVEMARRGFDLSGDLRIDADPYGQVVFPLCNLLTFAVLVGAGYWYRRRRPVHQRLMLLATMTLLNAPFAHLIGHSPVLRSSPFPIIVVLIVASLFASAAYDLLATRRVHPVSLWVAAGVFAFDNLQAAVIGPSATWHRLVAWMVS